ncbi:hypothetical protein CRIMD_58 [Mycobacterium phage CrimD]|uniref:Uncharacterized protein n=1 Tax=Mycobacterium phage CrimD TaxID=2919554 RepID=E0YQM0_9CAUD|nr:hypothetical protein CRIMD_58 [Mycobacterium phage CrimD]ADL71404.1 hypothetical protein CRIMD_58 [Mycobacterium phage CrimD]
MSENVTVGRVYVGEKPKPGGRTRDYVDVRVSPKDGNVWVSPSSQHSINVDEDQSRRIADLMARAHAAAPSIVAAYQTRERARETANATYQRIVRRAIEVGR